MKGIFSKAVIITVILFCNVMFVSCNDALEYELTSDKIERAFVYETSRGYAVGIELNEPRRKEFAELTGDNIERRLTITFAGKKLVSAIIKGRIESGDMTVDEGYSKEDAEKLVEELLSEQ